MKQPPSFGYHRRAGLGLATFLACSVLLGCDQKSDKTTTPCTFTPAAKRIRRDISSKASLSDLPTGPAALAENLLAAVNSHLDR